MRLACALWLVACGAAPRAPEIPALDETGLVTFREHTAMLRATLERSRIALDDAPVIEACASTCIRCETASGMDGIDTDLIDRVAIVFAGYPPSFFRAARVERLALCRRMRYEGNDDEGPAGLAQHTEHRLLVSVEHFDHDRGPFGIEQVVHHELFHLFDIETLGDSEDPEWLALVPRDFAYRDPATDTARRAGFINVYATTNPLEDRASTYEHLMAHADELCEVAARDKVLRDKARLVWTRVAKVTGDAFLRARAGCLEQLAPRARPKPKKRPAKRP